MTTTPKPRGRPPKIGTDAVAVARAILGKRRAVLVKEDDGIGEKFAALEQRRKEIADEIYRLDTHIQETLS